MASGERDGNSSSSDEPEETETKVSRSHRAARRKTTPREVEERIEDEVIEETGAGVPTKAESPNRKMKRWAKTEESVDEPSARVESETQEQMRALIGKSTLKNQKRRQRKRARKMGEAVVEDRKGILKTPQSKASRLPWKQVRFSPNDSNGDSPESDGIKNGIDLNALDHDSEFKNDDLDDPEAEDDDTDSDGFIGKMAPPPPHERRPIMGV